jgi:hypothetical protein
LTLCDSCGPSDADKANIADLKAFRVDLDDLGGEVCLVDWGEDHAEVVGAVQQPRGSHHIQLMQGRVSCLFAEETPSIATKNFKKRTVPLEGDCCDCRPLSPRRLDALSWPRRSRRSNR